MVPRAWAKCSRRFFYEVKRIVDCTRAVNFLRSKKEGNPPDDFLYWHMMQNYNMEYRMVSFPRKSQLAASFWSIITVA